MQYTDLEDELAEELYKARQLYHFGCVPKTLNEIPEDDRKIYYIYAKCAIKLMKGQVNGVV